MATRTPDPLNASLDAAIIARAESISLGAEALAPGETIVYLDEEGRMLRHKPDGMRTLL